MKIGTPDNQPVANAPVADRTVATAQRKAAAESSAAKPAQGGGTEVELSATASAMRSTPTEASFDADKVARISQAIRDGSFKVDPGKIADKLIANAQELLTRKPS